MANSAEFKILVTAVGDLTQAIKQSGALAGNVNKLNKAHDEGAVKSKKHADSLNSGVTGANNSTRSFSRLLDTVGGQNSGLVAAYATLATNAFAVSAAFNTLRSAATAEQILAGLEAQGARTGRTLTLAAKSVKEITGAAVSGAEAMTATALFTAAGFGTDELERLTQVATDTSFALGRNIPDSLDRLIKGTTKLEPELLDELGIMTKLTEATSIYARENGKSADSLTQFERRQAFLNAVLAEGEIKFGGLSDAAGNLKGYDKLAATFDDLTKAVVNVMNTALLPLANFLAGNMTSMLGLITMFAGSIRNQLIPGLREAAESQKKLAERTQELAETQAKSLSDVKGGPAVYNKLVTKIQEGTATTKDYDKALQSLNKSEELRRNYLKNGVKDTAKSQEGLDLVIKQKAALNELTESIQRKETITRKAAAMEYAGEINLLNIKESVRGMIESVSQSVVSYSKETAAGNTRVERGLHRVKVGYFAVGTAAKVAGVAALNMLPVIGQIIFAAGLLSDGFKYIYDLFQSPGQKEYNKEVEKLSEILTAIEEKTKRLQELNAKQGNAALVQVERYKLVSNSINEIVAQMNKVLAAENEIGKVMANNSVRRSKDLASSLGLYETKTSYLTAGISLDSDSAAGTKSQPILDSEEFKSAAAIYKLGIAGVNEQYDTLLKYDQKYLGADSATKRKLLADLNNKIADTYGNIGEAVQEASDSLKVLEQASIDFRKGAITSTPYDSLVTALSGSTTALAKLDIELEKSGINGKELANTLSAIGPATQSMLDATTMEGLRQINILGAELDAISKKLESAVGNEAITLRNRASSLEAELLKNKDIAIKARETLLSREREVKVLQEGVRQLKEQTSLEQAKLQATSSAAEYSTTALRNQLEGQNKVIDLQMQQNINQANFLKAQLSADKAALDSKKLELEMLRSQTKERLEQNKLALETQLADTKMKLTGSASIKYGPSIIDSVSKRPREYAIANASSDIVANDFVQLSDRLDEVNKKLLTAKAAKDTLLEDKRISLDIKVSEDSIRSAEQAINALQTAASAMSISKQTSGEINAAVDTLSKSLDSVKRIDELNIEKAHQNGVKAFTSLAILVNSSGESIETSVSKVSQVFEEFGEKLKRNKEESLKETDILSGRVAQFKALQTRPGLSSKDIAGLKEAASYLQDRIKALDKIATLNNTALVIETQLNMLIAGGVKGKEDHLNTLKETYDIKQQILDIDKESLDLASELLSIQTKLALQKLGGSGNTEYANRVRAAEDALIVAKNEAELKKSIIAMEFALLREKALATAKTAYDSNKSLDIAAANQRSIMESNPESILIQEAGNKALEMIEVQRDRNLKVIEGVGAVIQDGEVKLSDIFDKAEAIRVKGVQDRVDVLGESVNLAKFRKRIQGAGDIIGEMAGKYKDWQAEFDPSEKGEILPVKAMEANLAYISDMMGSYMDRIKDDLSALGPQGEIVLAIGQGIQNITGAFSYLVQTMKGDNGMEQLSAGLSVASAMLSTVASIVKATSDAKIAGIDREIAAEEKKDGKSAQSLAKIEAMEKKKDAIARKAFNTNKKLMMAQAVISTAAGIAGALGSMPGPAGIILAGIIGAMGAAQLAIIASTQYESSYSPKAAVMPSTLTIGKRNDSVDLAKGPNANAGGEVGYLRGTSGTGTGASNYRTVGSAYGGELMRGYGNRAFAVGEKGTEIIEPETPITVTPLSEYNGGGNPVSANINIQALDASGVKDVLLSQKGNIIQMLREAANASGKTFMEDVNVNVYTRPNIGKL